MTVSFGTEAEGAARASAGSAHKRNYKTTAQHTREHARHALRFSGTCVVGTQLVLPVTDASIPFFAGSWRKWERKLLHDASDTNIEIDDAEAKVEVLTKEEEDILSGYLSVALGPVPSAVGKLVHKKTQSAAEYQMKNMPPNKQRLLALAQKEKEKEMKEAQRKLENEKKRAADRKKEEQGRPGQVGQENSHSHRATAQPEEDGGREGGGDGGHRQQQQAQQQADQR
eukprot:scaffold29595_cov101-Isochrysis_galbana.AAC.1